jgi:hypothetical protein
MSNLTLANDTDHVAQFVVKRGELVIARIPGVEPGGRVLVPTDMDFEVIASVVVEPDMPVTATHKLGAAARFIASLASALKVGRPDFDLVTKPATKPDALQFEKTCLSPVVFTITRDGKPLQNVAVNDSFESAVVRIGNLFSVHAVVNGRSSNHGVTSNANAHVTLTPDSGHPESGYFSMRIN